jgi:hypothetical protein
MTGKAHKISRLATGIALAATIAAFAAPAAVAGSVLDGRSPDTRDAAMATHDSFNGLDPWMARVIAAHQQSLTPPDGRSPDTIDAAMATHDAFNGLDPWMARVIAAHQRSLTPPDGRSPDTIDAALQAHNPVVTVVTPNGFAWDDFGIGFAAAAGAMLLLAGLRMGLHTARRREAVTGSAASV